MKWFWTAGLLLTCGAAIGGWWLYDRGLRLTDVVRPHIRPAAIADTVTNYSPAQLQHARKTEPDMHHIYALDRSFVPRDINYIRMEYLAGQVDKPFPKLFIADKAFPYNAWILESVLTVTPDTMRQISSRADDLPCAADSADLHAGTDRFEVLLRPAGGPLKRCLISKEAGCRFVDMERRQAADNTVGDAELPLSEMDELQTRIACPKASVLPW